MRQTRFQGRDGMSGCIDTVSHVRFQETFSFFIECYCREVACLKKDNVARARHQRGGRLVVQRSDQPRQVTNGRLMWWLGFPVRGLSWC